MQNKIYSIILYLLGVSFLLSQTNDSLLKKIESIDISLSSPVESEENLMINTVSFESFYDLLSPAGEWIQVSKEEIDGDLNEGQGQSFSSVNCILQDEDEFLFIWKPSGVEQSWKPFSNGRWEFTTNGWMWLPSESWGWATTHYGRWFNSKEHGWVWMPGYQWSPSWVQWRVSEDYVGWVGLSPKAKWKSETGINSANYKYKNNSDDWVFVSKENFLNDVSTSNAVSKTQNQSLITNSNQVLDVKSGDNGLVHSGPELNDIEKRTGRTIKPNAIKFIKERRNSFTSGDEVNVSRSDFRKYELVKGRKIDKPKKYKMSKRLKKWFKKKKRLPPKRRDPSR